MRKPPTTTAIQTVAVMTKPVARPRPIRRSSNRGLSQLGKIAEPSRSQLHPGITRNAIACSRDMGAIQIVSDDHVTRLSIAATVMIPTPAIAMIRSSTPAARELNRHSRTDARALDHTTQSSRASGFSLLHMPRKCRSTALADPRQEGMIRRYLPFMSGPPPGYEPPTPVYVVGDRSGGTLAVFAQEEQADELLRRLTEDAPEGLLQITILPVYQRIEDWEYGS